MAGLTYWGQRIAHWHEEMVDGEWRLTLRVIDHNERSGRRVIAFTGLEAVMLKLALRPTLELYRPFVERQESEE